MSLDRKRWALIAQELKFSQLDTARKQADAWRNGLAALTALLTAILVLKGRDDVSALPPPFRITAVVLLGVALGLLVAATLLITRALAGPPGEEILLTGEDLEAWSANEVRKISTALRWAPWLAATGVLFVALAVGVTWLAPAQDITTPLVRVTTSTTQLCGEMIGASGHQLILRSSATTTLLSLSTVVNVTPVTNCP